MLPYQIIDGGRFTSTASLSKQVVLSDRPDLFWIRNWSAWGDDAAETSVEAWWRRGMAQGEAQTTDQTVGTGALSSEYVTTLGFTFIDTANPPTFAALSATAIDGTTFVVSMPSTAGLVVGDVVRIYNSTGMHQIGGLSFQITAVNANVSITLGFMAQAVTDSAVAAFVNGTTATVRKIIPNRMYPRHAFIAGITRAVQARVYFTRPNDFTPGEFIGLRIPNDPTNPLSYGAGTWSSINNRDFRVLSVTNDTTESSVLLDLDTSGIASAFTYPLTASADLGISPAVAVPSTSGVVPLFISATSGSATNPQIPEGYNLLDAFDNRNKYIMDIGSNVITSAEAIYDWVAFKYDRFTVE